VSDQWSSGSEYSTFDLDPPPPDPGDPQEGGSITNSPETGFYRVVRRGAHLYGITNGMTFSGIVAIPIEVGNDSGSLIALSARENGSPVGNSQAAAPFHGPLQVMLDTTTMANGTHAITAFASWNSGFDIEDWGDGPDAESPEVSVNVYNEITFPNWIEHYGELYNAVLITAQSAHTDADWHVDVYGSDAGYIGTFSGHTYDGNIYGWWNLVGPPPASITYTNERYFDFVFTTVYSQSVAGNGPEPESATSTATKRTYKQADNWTGSGMWVVANQQAWEGFVGHEELDLASDGFTQLAEGIGLTVRPSHQSGESFRIQFGNGVLLSTREAQWASMRSALFHPESRNVFYFGHGASTQIGAGGGTAGTGTNLCIPATEIAARLHTMPAGQTNRHGYRFVFLFGCETASGTLPESFGIIHRENVNMNDYINDALTPGAFVGWNKEQAAGIASMTFMDDVHYLQHFQLGWTLYGFGVNEALDRAKTDYRDVSFIDRSSLKCFGNWELRLNNFNR
jgi:hypothetical protein